MKIFKKKLSIEEIKNQDTDNVLEYVKSNVKRILPDDFNIKITAWKNYDEINKIKSKSLLRTFTIYINYDKVNQHKKHEKLLNVCEFLGDSNLSVLKFNIWDDCSHISFLKEHEGFTTLKTLKDERLLKLKKLNKYSLIKSLTNIIYD